MYQAIQTAGISSLIAFAAQTAVCSWLLFQLSQMWVVSAGVKHQHACAVASYCVACSMHWQELPRTALSLLQILTYTGKCQLLADAGQGLLSLWQSQTRCLSSRRWPRDCKWPLRRQLSVKAFWLWMSRQQHCQLQQQHMVDLSICHYKPSHLAMYCCSIAANE